MRVAILTDFPVVTYANGPALATQALKRYLEQRGHQVTLVGPRPGPEDPQAAEGSVLLDSVQFRAHDGVRLPFAWPPEAFANQKRFDVVHAHSTSLLMHWGPMMRRLYGIPCIATNTIYLPSFAQHVLPEALHKVGWLRERLAGFAPAVEASFTRSYNSGDGLIVQCEGLAQYWRDYGLQVPLHVIPRPIDTAVFDAPLGPDPFRPEFVKGARIVSVGRHAREKDIDKLIRAFAAHVLPQIPHASLTLVGDGMEHKRLQRLAEELGVHDRVDFPGERPHKDLRHYCGHADLFGYTSMSETYGQVISEALWCGRPVVALDDSMGVAFQVENGEDGVLVPPGPEELAGLGAAIVTLLENDELRHHMGARASAHARLRVSPDAIYARYEAAYAAAIEHRDAHPPEPFCPVTAQSWRGLLREHVVPWTGLQALAVTLGSLRKGTANYTVPRHLRVDELPDDQRPARVVHPQTRVRPLRDPHPVELLNPFESVAATA